MNRNDALQRIGLSAYWALWQIGNAPTAIAPESELSTTDPRFSQSSPLFVAVSRGLSRAYFAVGLRLFWGANITMLQGNAVDLVFQTEVISPEPLLRLAADETPAPIAVLSVAKRNALLACIKAGGLYRKAGAWHGPGPGRPLSGVTIADLARDGLLTVTVTNRLGSAQFTERGKWFARTLLDDEGLGEPFIKPHSQSADSSPLD